MFLAAGCGSQDESVFLHCTVPHLYSSLADRPFSTSSHFRFRICSRGFVGISHPLVGRLCEKVPIESVNMCVFSGFFVFQANFGPSFGHRISDLQEVPNPLFHCFLQWICNTSEVGVLKRTRGFRSAGLFMINSSKMGPLTCIGHRENQKSPHQVSARLHGCYWTHQSLELVQANLH